MTTKTKVGIAIVLAAIGGIIFAVMGRSSSHEVMSAELPTMRLCLASVAESSGSRIGETATDTPDRVSGNLADGRYFACERKETGTKGTYFEGAYEAGASDREDRYGAAIDPRFNPKDLVCTPGRLGTSLDAAMRSIVVGVAQDSADPKTVILAATPCSRDALRSSLKDDRFSHLLHRCRISTLKCPNDDAISLTWPD